MKRIVKLIWLVLLGLCFLAGCTLIDEELSLEPSASSNIQSSQSEASPDILIGFEEVAAYIQLHQELPANFITKAEARKLGWVPEKGNLNEVAPGKSIGGDVFHNREGKLPKKQGRVWYEADIHYESGTRGKDRIVYSNDGLIFMTEDHYETFEQMK